MNNRTIKFRVWSKKTKSWVHGPHKDPSLDGVNLFGEKIMFGELLHGVSIENYNDCIAVQYTGLKDIHGAELFEGDICKFEGEDRGPRKYFEAQTINFEWGGFRINGYPLENFIENELDAARDHCSLEKIGNVFENPEILGNLTKD